MREEYKHTAFSYFYYKIKPKYHYLLRGDDAGHPQLLLSMICHHITVHITVSSRCYSVFRRDVNIALINLVKITRFDERAQELYIIIISGGSIISSTTVNYSSAAVYTS